MGDNTAGFTALEAMIQTIKGFPDMVKGAAPAVAEAAAAAIRKDLAAGVDPGTGKAWPPTKKGGGQAMKGAAAALQVAVAGSKITYSMGLPYVFHHFGAGGEPVRRVLPVEDYMPEKLGDAIRLGFVKPFKTWARGKK